MNILTLIPPDKHGHFTMGALAYLFTALLALMAHGHYLPWAGLAGAAIAGAAKEGYDFVDDIYLKAEGKPPAHTVDVWDFVATVAGGAACFAASFLQG